MSSQAPPSASDDDDELLQLDLSHRDLHSLQPAQLRYPNLRSLNLSYNRLTSIEFRGLTELRELRLTGNALVSLPACVLACKRLETLDVADNALNVAPLLASVRSLRHLSLARNALVTLPEGSVPRHLSELDVGGNQLRSLSAVSQLVHLVELDLSNNGLVKVPSLSRLQQLESLVLSGNRLGPGFKLRLSKPCYLRHLDIADNQLDSLAALPKLADLAELHMSGNNLGSLAGLGKQFPSLDVLDVSHNALGDTGGVINELVRLEVLGQLFLEGNPLAQDAAYPARIVTALVKHTSLTHVDGALVVEEIEDEDARPDSQAMRRPLAVPISEAASTRASVTGPRSPEQLTKAAMAEVKRSYDEHLRTFESIISQTRDLMQRHDPSKPKKQGAPKPSTPKKPAVSRDLREHFAKPTPPKGKPSPQSRPRTAVKRPPASPDPARPQTAGGSSLRRRMMEALEFSQRVYQKQQEEEVEVPQEEEQHAPQQHEQEAYHLVAKPLQKRPFSGARRRSQRGQPTYNNFRRPSRQRAAAPVVDRSTAAKGWKSRLDMFG